MTAPLNCATLETMSWPGGKAQAGVYQTLINQIPPHDCYIAPFAGDDAIARRKIPSRSTVLIDRDSEALTLWRDAPIPGIELHQTCGITWLKYRYGLFRLEGSPHDVAGTQALAAESAGEVLRDPATHVAASRLSRYRDFVFCDPPYLMATRTSGPMYRFEMTDDDHLDLVETLKRLPVATMICGYWSEMYADALRDWRVVEYRSVARSGDVRQEFAWCNFEEPDELHDYRYLGHDKRERERIRRRVKNWRDGLSKMPDLERQAIMRELQS
ncbi:MAG: hypothetical protein ACPHCN_13405 [Mycobacterium sp.]